MASTTELRDRIPDTVPDDIELFERDGGVWGRDDHGEFKLDPMTGTAEPQDGRCGAVCRYTMDRYGETRYCSALPVGKFEKHAETNYDHPEYCRNHQSRHALMERAHELFEHGYFATNYVNFSQKLPAEKFLFAVEMLGGLFEKSQHDFNITDTERVIDTTESDMIVEDEVSVSLPIPQNETLSFQANELWMAALDEVKVQNMQEVVFTDGMSRQTIADTADMEGQITDVKKESVEHHLHLPISRLTKDIKEHLKNGGVAIDDDEGGVITFQQNDYTLDVQPEETDSEDTEGVSDVAEEFTTEMQPEEDAAEVEIE